MHGARPRLSRGLLPARAGPCGAMLGPRLARGHPPATAAALFAAAASPWRRIACRGKPQAERGHARRGGTGLRGDAHRAAHSMADPDWNPLEMRWSKLPADGAANDAATMLRLASMINAFRCLHLLRTAAPGAPVLCSGAAATRVHAPACAAARVLCPRAHARRAAVREPPHTLARARSAGTADTLRRTWTLCGGARTRSSTRTSPSTG